MYLAQVVEDSVQTGRALSISFDWLFPLTGFVASESGIDCRILVVVAVNAALLLPFSCFLPFLPGRFCFFRRALPLLSLVSKLPRFLVKLLLRASQLSSPVQKRVMSVVRAAIDL